MATAQTKHPVAIICWAAVITSSRSRWIHHETLSRTRHGAKQAYLSCWDPAYRKEALQRVCFERVLVSPLEARA